MHAALQRSQIISAAAPRVGGMIAYVVTVTADSGVQRYGSLMSGANQAPPGGASSQQTGLVRAQGVLSTTAALAAGQYSLSFQMANRSNCGGQQAVQVRVAGTTWPGSYTPTTSFASYSASFSVATGGIAEAAFSFHHQDHNSVSLSTTSRCPQFANQLSPSAMNSLFSRRDVPPLDTNSIATRTMRTARRFAALAVLAITSVHTAHAASTAATVLGGFVIKSSTPFGAPSASTAALQVVSTSPKISDCRFGAVFISASRPNATALRAEITQARISQTPISLTYTKAPDGVCLLDATGSAPTATLSGASASLSSGESGDTGTMWEGYHNKYASSFKSAFRDFGQGKFDESVDAITGVLVLTHTELVIPGPRGLDIKVTRRYQSPDPKTVALSMGVSLNPQFTGMGWDIISVVGGLQGVAACSSSYLAGDPQVPFYAMRYFQLPVWVDGNGHSETLLYDGTGWEGPSGLRINCSGADSVQPYAITPDGTKVTISVPTDPYYGLPTRVEDRYGNWIQIEYVPEYLALLIYEGLGGLVKTGRVPIKKITASDGRVVDFEYASGDPSWPAGSLPSLFDFYLKKIKYSGNEIEYQYQNRSTQVDSLSGGGRVSKFFLSQARYADGLTFRYAYDLARLPANDGPDLCRPAAGAALLTGITHPHGGVTNYSWVSSGRVDAPYACWLFPFASWVSSLHNMLRSKTTSDGGSWRYSYSDMSSFYAQSPADDYVGAGPRPAWTEWGKIVGPDSTIVSLHVDRYGVQALTSESGNFNQAVAPSALGRLIRRDVYAPDTTSNPLQTENFTYSGVGLMSGPGILVADPTLMFGNQTANMPYAAGWPGIQALKTQVHTIQRGSANYSTAMDYSNLCYSPTKFTESGNRNKTIGRTFGARNSQYCQVLNEKVSADGILMSETKRTLTADGRAIAQETKFGPVGSAGATIGLTQSFTYTSAGDIASQTDARGFTSYFNSYSRGKKWFNEFRQRFKRNFRVLSEALKAPANWSNYVEEESERCQAATA